MNRLNPSSEGRAAKINDFVRLYRDSKSPDFDFKYTKKSLFSIAEYLEEECGNQKYESDITSREELADHFKDMYRRLLSERLRWFNEGLTRVTNGLIGKNYG